VLVYVFQCPALQEHVLVSVFQCPALCSIVQQCAAVCCSVLQCVSIHEHVASTVMYVCVSIHEQMALTVMYVCVYRLNYVHLYMSTPHSTYTQKHVLVSANAVHAYVRLCIDVLTHVNMCAYKRKYTRMYVDIQHSIYIHVHMLMWIYGQAVHTYIWLCMYIWLCLYMHKHVSMPMFICVHMTLVLITLFEIRYTCWYGVAPISRLLQILGLFCKRAL